MEQTEKVAWEQPSIHLLISKYKLEIIQIFKIIHNYFKPEKESCTFI